MAIGPILGALVSGIGAVGSIGANNAANQVNWASLLETKRANRANEKLAKSSRTDALGNTVRFDNDLNQWLTDLDPTTAAILGNEQAETLLSLIKDAPRNRRAAERMDARSQEGDEAFSQAMNDYRFRTPRSEKAAVAENQQQLLRNRRQGLSEASNVLAKQAIRGGDSNAIQSILKEADNMFAGSLDDAMFEGRQRGRQQFQQDEAFDQGQMLQAIQAFGNIANNTTTSPVGTTNADEWANATQENALSTLLQTMMGGQDRIASSMQNLSSGMRNFPSLDGVASALAKINFGSSGSSTKTQNRLRADVR